MRLEESIPDLRRLTTEEPLPAIEQARVVLRSAGVVLCLVPPVPGLGIHGATRWLNGTPVIQLSLLQKSDDQWWFTLFHEIGHVLLHRESDLYLLGDDADVEQEADAFATDTLIPAEYRDLLPRTRNLSAIEQLAYELGIAPSIVLGQAQRVTGDYAWGQGLKRKIDKVLDGFDVPQALRVHGALNTVWRSECRRDAPLGLATPLLGRVSGGCH